MDNIVLEERIVELERKVFGAHLPAAVNESESCAQTLQAVNKKFEDSTAKRDKVQRILVRLTEIEKYMDAGFCEESALSTDCKVRVILSEEHRIKETAAALERLAELRAVLDSEHLSSVDQKLLLRFAEMKQRQLEQTDDVQQLQEQASQLMNVYFSFMDLVSKQYIAWNKRLRKAEGK